MSEKNIIHPKITAIQNHINLCNQYIRENDMRKFLKEMTLTILELFPEDQPKELLDKIIKERKTIYGFKSARQGTLRTEKRMWIYLDWFTDLQGHIANCGYFEGKKYSSGDFSLFTEDDEFTDE